MKYSELKELGFRLSSFVVGTEGNISKRTEDGFVIKASGKSLKYLDDDSLVRCAIDGNATQGQSNRPSMESGFHAWIYRNSGCQFIAHTHPTNVLKILCSDWVDEFATERLFPDQVVFNDVTACVVPYATPGENLTHRIDDAVLSFINTHGVFPNLLLLKNHGIICCTHSVEHAIIMTEICEKAAEIFIGAKLLGKSVFLSKERVSDVQNHDGEIYRRKV